MTTPTALKSELLCFIVDRSRVLAFDDIVKICTDFYSDEEVFEARQTLTSLGHHLSKRQGNDKMSSTVKDIVKLVLNPKTSLPAFYAVDLARLPPVSATHCDVSLLLSELQGLRAEVRGMSQLKAEIDLLKDEMKALRQQHLELICCTKGTNDFPPLSATSMVEDSVAASDGKCFASLAREIAKDPSAVKNLTRKKQKGSTKVVVGVSSSSNLKTVKTVRDVDIFVSRMHPETACNELIDCVQSIRGDLSVANVVCTKLVSKHEHLYSSFHVAVTVDTTDLKTAVEHFMSPTSWPNGAFVKRYYRRKNGSVSE